MNRFAKTFTLSACALAASLLISACGGGTAGDTVAPTVTITSAASTVAGNVTFTFKFSESVGTSFSVEDLVVTNGTPGGLTKVDATTYTVDVTPGASAPSVSLAAGKVYDLANNPNVAAANNTFNPNAVTMVGGTGNTGACTTTSTVNCFGFEDTSVLLEAFEGLASAGTVTDPAGGTNKVLQLVKVPLVGTVGSQPWAGVTLHTSAGTGNAAKPFTSPAIAFASSKVITMRVLSPAAGKPITLKVENSADAGVNMLKTVNTTKANEWETLSFDFATPTQSSGVANAFVANATFDVISLFPDFMTAETADVSYYFDELTYATATGGGAATGPTTAAATPTALAANVISIYSDAYSNIAGTDFFPNWGQSSVVSDFSAAGNATKKVSGLNYQGIALAAPIDVSTMGKLHMDVWSAAAGTLNIGIITSSAVTGGAALETQVPQTLVAGWNSLDIPLTSFTAPNLTKIDQLILVGSGTIYFDNLYFWKAATTPVSCGTTEPTCAPTTVIPAGAVTIYSEASATAGFNAFPNWGQSTQYSEVTLAGNKSLKYSSLNYEGIELTTVDVSAKGKLHLDVWSAAGGTLNVGIITSGKITGGGALETQVPQTLVAGWNSLDIPLTSFTAPDKTKIDQLIFVGAGTIFVDNIYFWDTASAPAGGGAGSCTAGVAMGAGGAQTMALSSGDSKGIFAAGEGLFAFDYKGSLDSLGHYAGWVGGRSDGTPSCGDIGYFNDTAMSASAQKIDEGGWIVGTSLDPGGTPNFFRYFVLTAPSSTFASSYIGLFANAPNNGTLNVSTFGSIKFRMWGPAEMYQQSNLNPVVEMVLSGPKVAGCTTGSGGTEISKNVTANLKIGAGSAYKVGLAGFTIKGVCGGDTNGTAVASVLSNLARVAFTVPASSFNFVNANPGTPVTYSSGINLGPIGFTNN